MIAYVERPTTAIALAPKKSTPSGEGAKAMALAYLRYASACWRGEACAHRFATRLGAYWRPQLPPLPLTPPHAFSPHGAGGRGIAWYQSNGDVLGVIPGCQAGYQVPLAVIPRLLEGLPDGVSITPKFPFSEGGTPGADPIAAGLAA